MGRLYKDHQCLSIQTAFGGQEVDFCFLVLFVSFVFMKEVRF